MTIHLVRAIIRPSRADGERNVEVRGFPPVSHSGVNSMKRDGERSVATVPRVSVPDMTLVPHATVTVTLIRSWAHIRAGSRSPVDLITPLGVG